MRELKLTSFDGLTLQCYAWEDVKQPKGVVQIIHGLTEHAKRYDPFATALNKAGYIVFGYDQRGHGLTLEDPEKHGQSDGDIFSECVLDAITVTEFITNTYKDLPIHIFAHSYGSFVAQKYIQVCDSPSKVILCGTTYGSDLLYHFGKIPAFFTSLKGKHAKAKLIEAMSFKAYSKSFEDGNWITRDKEIYKQYTTDQLCGKPFPISFYKSMFRNLTKLNKGISEIKDDLKIFLIVGNQDRVSHNGKGVKKLHRLYQKRGKNARLKIYDGARHELMNEINKQEVFEDVIDFLDK